ncbi:hypothetical protein GIB67_034918 [Kingdonia uniflora]|uniref:CCHC-type domain-containing protein n=1 Tax=Kingdonia uniflora TaxID=39325 RepID=A0A7J7NGT9_9MAGN|nr:hypothetical protein GIB67_034918 [Kingdonia uniflora]
MGQEEAMQMYIIIVSELFPTWTSGSTNRKDGDLNASSSDGNSMMEPVFSTYVYEEEADNEMRGYQGYRKGRNQKPFGPRKGKGFRKSWILGNVNKEKKIDQGSTCFNCGDTGQWARECLAPRVAIGDRVRIHQAVVDTNFTPVEVVASDFFDDTDVAMDQHTE